MHTPKFMNPLFYIKKTGDNCTVMHRLTHSYIASFTDEELMVEYIDTLVSMKQEDLWRFLIFDRKIRIPNPKSSVIAKSTKDNDEAEEWYRNAWSIYTDLFYTQNPDLLVEEDSMPTTIINKLRKEAYLVDMENSKKRQAELREAEEREKLNEKIIRKQIRKAKTSDKVKEVPEGTLGSVGALEKMQKKKKKLFKKVLVKTPSAMEMPFIDSDDPFA